MMNSLQRAGWGQENIFRALRRRQLVGAETQYKKLKPLKVLLITDHLKTKLQGESKLEDLSGQRAPEPDSPEVFQATVCPLQCLAEIIGLMT